MAPVEIAAARDHAAIEATVATDGQIVAGTGIAVAEAVACISAVFSMTTAMDMATVDGCIVEQCAAAALTGGIVSKTA